MLPDPQETLEVSPASVLGWLDLPASDRPRLIDCREADELAICQLPGNEWLPLGQFPEALNFFKNDISRGIVIYCHHGVRSARAASFLRAHGIQNAFSLAGGTDLWSRTIDPEMPRY
ncbi:MAG: rhodanese-like domain-containing protein [Luteolibacter sp.]